MLTVNNFFCCSSYVQFKQAIIDGLQVFGITNLDALRDDAEERDTLSSWSLGGLKGYRDGNVGDNMLDELPSRNEDWSSCCWSTGKVAAIWGNNDYATVISDLIIVAWICLIFLITLILGSSHNV